MCNKKLEMLIYTKGRNEFAEVKIDSTMCTILYKSDFGQFYL